MKHYQKYLRVNNSVSKLRNTLLLLLLIVSSIFSQDPNWSSVMTFPQYPSPFISDWEENPNLGTLNIQYTGTAPIEFYFEVIITVDGYGEAIKGKTAPREYFGAMSEILTFNDFSDWESPTYNEDLKRVILQTGKLPESDYSICVNTYSTNGTLLTEACSDFSIALPNPPQLIFPEEGASVQVANPTFMWNPIVLPYAIDFSYQMKVVEILQGQTPYRALVANVPVVEKIVDKNVFTYLLDDYPLEQNHSYAWQVQITNDVGEPIFPNGGFSEIWQFTYGSPAGEIGIDTLQLIEDFAYLIDLGQLQITENGASLQLDGSCRMLIRESGVADKFVDVFTQNLMIQKDSYENPVFLGGNVVGSLAENILANSVVGDYFHPTDLEFVPPNLLTIVGNFYLSDDVDIPLNGRLNYLAGELSGNLSLSGDPSSPVFSMGDELVKVDVTSLSLTYPSVTTDIQGVVSLFGSASNCNLSSISLNKKGDYSAGISCNVGQDIALLDGSTMFNLKVENVNGSISGNLLTKSVNYDVQVDGGMLFNIDPNNAVGADVSFQLKPNDFKLTSFIPSSNLQTVTLDLGWLAWNLDNLKLNDLKFKDGNWDFDLAMDIDISFPDFTSTKLPTIHGISFTPSGIVFPKVNFDNFSIPNIDFAGFSLDLYGFATQGFAFDLGNWTPGSIAKMAFDWKVKFNMPNLPAGTDDGFKLPNWDLGAKIVDGNFELKFPDMNFKDNFNIPIPGNLNFDVKSLTGALNTNFNGSLMSFLPDVNIGGTITLPEALRCKGGSGKIDISKIKLNGNGTFSGEIDNFVPKCPINIGLASLYMKKSKLEFSGKKGQKILLSGAAGIKFTNNPTQKEVGELEVIYEVINSRLLKVEGKIEEDFRWDLPAENPMFSFDVSEALLSNGSLTIDSRSQLNLPGNEKIGVTFDKFKINLNDYSVEDGQIIFDQPFAMVVEGLDNNGINFKAVKKGNVPRTNNFIYLELPSQIKLDKNGFALEGESKAKMEFSGKKLDELSTKFSKDFAFSLMPFKVTRGRCEIFLEKDKVAYLNRDGFFPDVTYFLNRVIPEKLPLPALDIAYLQIKSERDKDLLVDISTEGSSTRFSTRAGEPIELVFPSLKFQSPAAPKILVNFSIAIDDVTGRVTDGFIRATVPEQSAADFDLSKVGIPYVVQTIYYGNVNGVTQFEVKGKVKAFETELGCDSLTLNITQAGVLQGHADCNVAKTIHLIPDSDNLNLVVNRVAGDFNVNLRTEELNFDLTLDSDLRFTTSPSETFGIWTRLGLNSSGISLIDSRTDSLRIPKIDLSQFKLGLENLRIGKLSYSKLPNIDGITGWDFEFGMDLDFDFTGLNFTIPKIPNVVLNRTGFHTMSEISIPSFSDSLKFEFNGIELKPLAFRMPKLDFDWFNSSDNSSSNWGFKFDFEVNFPNLADASGAMKFPRLTIRNAGFLNGIITGNISPVTFDASDGLDLNLGTALGFSIRTITGGLFDNSGSQGVGFKFKGDLKLPEFMRCDGQSASVSMGNAEFSLNSLGQVSGAVQNFVPTCPIDLGFGKFNVNTSSISFAIAQSQQSAVLDMTGALLVNTGNNNTVTANGALKLNLLTGEVVDGEIGINQQFVWGIPSDNPVLNFTINSAILNKDGLKIDGASTLKLPNNQTQAATFNNLVFDYRRLRVKSGSLSITGGFGLKLAIGDSDIDWSVVPANETLSENKTAKIGFTSTLTLDSTGISVSGDARAAIRWDDDPTHQFGDIRITYSNDFKFSISPFKVSQGRADLIYNDNVIASLTHDGLTLGNIFGIIPMPEIIPLPSRDIAYLRIKKGNQLLVQSERVGDNLRIYTTNDNPVSLLLPALKYGSAEVDSIPTIFDVVINPSSGQLVSGEITLAKNDSSSLLNLKDRGIPVDIYKIHYGNSGSGYALTADANIAIPDVLDGLPLKLRKLTFNSSGFSGNVSIGEFSETYRANMSTVARASVGTEASITLEGLSVNFGATNSFKFSGKLIPKMLVKGSDTTKIQYASTWSSASNKFTFSFDFATGNKFDFGIGSFKPMAVGGNPAMRLSLTDNDFELMMNGEFKAEPFGNDFALTIEGLKITKNSVSAEAISKPRIHPLEFNLFNSQFRIFDQSAQNKAVRFQYNNGVLKLVLNGELEIFDRTTSFTDFTIGTDGTLSIGNSNFIAGSDLVVVQNYLALNNLGIASETHNGKTEYKLAVGGWVKLPEPVGDANTQFDFGFRIAPNGTITADTQIGNKIIFINEQQGIGNGDQSEFDFWKAKFDLTYLALDLNFNSMASSSINMVADIYWNNNRRVSIGNKSNANNVVPGLKIDFNGTVDWREVTVHGNFEFDSDMLKVGVSNMQLHSDASKNLTISLNGHLGLNLPTVSGNVELTNFKFNKAGIVNIGHIEGGELNINGVVKLELNNIVYRDSPSDIWVKKSEAGGGADSTQITVNNYLSFGGEVTIDGLGSGGVDRFLTYSTDNSFTLLIKNANFAAAGGTVNVSMDLLYKSGENGFLIRAGGKADIKGQRVIVLGKIAKIDNKLSFGFFLAADVRIDIIPGVIVISEVGGGFFYNPTADDISTVKRLADVGESTNGKIKSDGGKFAVFLYGQAMIVGDALVSGRALITITDNEFMLDGKVILLNQQNRIEGEMHLIIQWSPTFSAEGTISVDVKVPYIVTGKGNMGFYVYSKNQWAIYGSTEMKLFNYINSSSEFFVGNSGFMIGMATSFDFDIWIIEVGAGIEVKVWYLTGKSWGAYAEAYVKAEILWGLVKAKGWLKCALINSGGHTFLYGQAGMKIRTFLKDWDGSVWAKIDNGDLSGGRGSDSDMDALIAEAAGQSQQAEQEMNEMKNSIESRPPNPVNGAEFSEEELQRAFTKLTEYGTKYKYGNASERAEAISFFNQLKSVEDATFSFPFSFFNFTISYSSSNAETNLYNWVINSIYKSPNAPNLSGYNSHRRSIQTAIQEYETAKDALLPLLDEALNSINTTKNEFNQTVSDPTSGAQIVTHYTDENGNRRTEATGISLDENRAGRNTEELNNGIASIEQYRESVYAEYVKLNTNINQLEKVLRGVGNNSGKRGAEKFAESYAKVMGEIQTTYFFEYNYYKQLYSWASRFSSELSSRNVRTTMNEKARTIYGISFSDAGYYLLAAINIKRVEEIAKLSGKTDAEVTQLANQENTAWVSNHSDLSGSALRNWAINQATNKGTELWRGVPHSGLQELENSTRTIANDKLDEKIQNIEGMGYVQADFTDKMNTIYSSLSSLSESKYDILTKLVEWENEPKFYQINNVSADLGTIYQANDYSGQMSGNSTSKKERLEAAKRLLEEKMTVPIISSLRAYNRDMGIGAIGTFSWSVSGPRSDKITYMVNYDCHTPNINAQGFQAIGNKRNFYLTYTPRIGGTSFGATNFYLKARNEVGYTIHRNLTFTPTFSNKTRLEVGTLTTTEAPRDDTPPVVSRVLYPGYKGHYFIDGTEDSPYYLVQYVGDSTRISVKWAAYDHESGIQEYRYKLFDAQLPTRSVNTSATSGGNTRLTGVGVVRQAGGAIQRARVGQVGGVVQQTGAVQQVSGVAQAALLANVPSYADWTNNFGRRNATINGLEMHDGDVYQVKVAAKNGDGVWAENSDNNSFQAGKDTYLQVDLTPPPPPTRGVSPVYAIYSYLSTDYSVRGEVELPSGAENSGSQVTQYYVGLTQNGSANSGITLQNGFADKFGSFNPVEILGFSNQITAGNASANYTYTGASVGSYLQIIQYFDNSEAEVNVNYTAPIDVITGNPFRVEARITSVHNDTVATRWFRTSTGTFNNNIAGVNNILSYIDSFYVDLRCVDLAKNRSDIIRFVVQPHDNTPPTRPLVNFAYSSNKQRAYLVFDTQSIDPQCGIDHYEVGLGSTASDVTFDDSIKVYPSEISRQYTVLLPRIGERNRTVFAVRAVNTQGTRGAICYTGTYYKDNTPPERPAVSGLRAYENGSISKVRQLSFRVDHLVDSESFIVSYEYRIRKNVIGVNSSDGSSGTGWGNNRTTWNTIKAWTESTPAVHLQNLSLRSLGVSTGDRIRVEVRAKNNLGMYSTIGAATYIIPDFTRPLRPDVNITSVSSGKDSPKRVGLSFTNINDPESGVVQIKYKLYKAPASSGKRISRPHYTTASGWINAGTSRSTSFRYSRYRLTKGMRVKVIVKVKNGAGLWSVERERTHKLN